MGKRAALTLIFLGAHRTDRVDLGPAPGFAVLEQSHKEARGSDDPAERVEACLVSTPRIGKVVWVLWEGASAQVLDMPNGVVQGMEREQLAGALGFEAEPLTGVPAAESAIDGVQQKSADGVLPEFRRFWITQLTSEVRDKIEQVVTRAGARFAGITHPGGLPRDRWDATLAPEAPHEWRRIEIWDQVTFSIYSSPDGGIDTRIVRTSSEGWTSVLPAEGKVSWMAAGPATHSGSSGQRVPDPQRMALWDALMSPALHGSSLEAVKIDFPESAPPVDWLRAWAAELTAQKRVPTVEPPSRVSPYRKFYVTGGVAAAVVLSACLAHGWYLSEKAAQLQALADRAEATRAALTPKNDTSKEEAQLAAQVQELQPQLKELETRHLALQAESDRETQAAARLSAQQARLKKLQGIHGKALAELLGAVVALEQNESPDKIVLKDIRQEESGALRLTGLCGEPAYADTFATQLESRLNTAGWNVGAARKIVRGDRQAFDFTIVLTPVVLQDFQAPFTRPILASKPSGTARARDVRQNAEIVQAPQSARPSNSSPVGEHP